MGSIRRLAIPLLAIALVAAACGDDGQPSTGRDGVTVGAFGFSESRILAELYARRTAMPLASMAWA